MPGRNFEKASHRAHQLSRSSAIGPGTGYGKPVADRPRRKWCSHCKLGELPEGREEGRCDRCLADLQLEAELNGLDPTLDEDTLIETLKSIAAVESKVILHAFVAERERRQGNHHAARDHRHRAVLRSIDRDEIVERAQAA